jgi:predicted TIM-barrel fold metal-dependent hydrolase
VLPVVDAHHHLWDLNNRYPWLQDEPADGTFLGDTTSIRRNYLAPDLLADASSLQLLRSVHVEAGWDPQDPVGETHWLTAHAQQHGFPHAVVAYAELCHPDVETILSRHCESPLTRGIRQILNYHPDPRLNLSDRSDYLRDSSWRRGFALLEEHNLSFDLSIYPSQMADAAQLAHDHPNIRIILNHAGMPIDRTPRHIDEWRRGIALLAAEGNVMTKISGLGMFDRAWTVTSISPWVESLIEHFSPARCMFASNFPVDKLYGSYTRLWSAFDAITAGYSSNERDAMFSRTAIEAYRL